MLALYNLTPKIPPPFDSSRNPSSPATKKSLFYTAAYPMPTGPTVSTAIAPPCTSTTCFEDLHPDVLTRTLRLLDGPTLAAACSTTSHLRSLSSESDLWLHLCISTWPSLRHPLILPLLSISPRSFFVDAFPFPAAHSAANAFAEDDLPGELISAVDIYHRGVLILSRVVETETSSPWFRGSPFWIDAMELKSEPPLPGVIISPEELTLSWILIDPARRRAVNVSSRRAVTVERHWYTGMTMVRFVAAGSAAARVIGPVVTCEEGTGHVRKVVLTADDIDGACVCGGEALQVVRAVMEAGRKGSGRGDEEEEAKESYLDYLRRKRSRKERKARREWAMDLCCTAVGVAVFLAFLSLVVFG